jgi:hypothetical protein
MSLRLCMLFEVNKHLYAFYIYMRNLSRVTLFFWTFGENACHPERSEGAGVPDAEILRCAQDDSQALRMTGRTPLYA